MISILKILLVEFPILRPRNFSASAALAPCTAHAAVRQNPKCSNTCGLAVRLPTMGYCKPHPKTFYMTRKERTQKIYEHIM